MSAPGQSVFNTLLDVLDDNLSLSPLFAWGMFLSYCFTLTCRNPDLPLLIVMERKGFRACFVECLWCYVAVTYAYQALDGIYWTVKNGSLVTQAKFTRKLKLWHKIWLYMSSMVNFGLPFIVQPLVFLCVACEMGRSPWFGAKGAESSLYATLLLHVLKILFETIEQVAHDTKQMDLRLTTFFVVGIWLAILEQRGYRDATYDNLKNSWESAKRYAALGALAKKNVGKRDANQTQMNGRFVRLSEIKPILAGIVNRLRGINT